MAPPIFEAPDLTPAQRAFIERGDRAFAEDEKRRGKMPKTLQAKMEAQGKACLAQAERQLAKAEMIAKANKDS